MRFALLESLPEATSASAIDMEPRARGVAGYAVVHLVSQEMSKDLIGSQVIDHMQSQCGAGGDDRPAAVAVAFLEPARRMVSRLTWRRRGQLARRASGVRVAVLPVVGRLSLASNACLLALAIRRVMGAQPIVFHCRGESPALWANAIRAHIPNSGFVLDVRGATPEEILFAHGYAAAPLSSPAIRKVSGCYRTYLAAHR